MKLTSKIAGLGIMAVAGLMLCTAAIGESMGNMPMGGDESGAMMRGPMMDLTAMDANKDGKVSKDEVSAYRATEAAAVDINADGKLSVDELAAMRAKQMTAVATKMAQRMVDRLDTDGDKLLSATELAARPMHAELFDRVDANKDGFIDQAELDSAKDSMMRHGQNGGRHHGGKHGNRGGQHGQDRNGDGWN